MLSPSRANHLVACLPSLSLNCTRNIISTRGRPLRLPKVASKEASEPLPSPVAQLRHLQCDASKLEHSLATSLSHYSTLPPLPPINEWVSHFAYASPQMRDRISIRAPESAISIARSFINSKTAPTNNPKVIIEAFPGVRRLKAVVTLLSYPV